MSEAENKNTENTENTEAAAAAAAAEAAAPDAVTAKAAKKAAADKAAGKTETEIVDEAQAERAKAAAARAKVKPAYYRTVHGGVMIDPETGKEFNGSDGIKSHMTSWLELQIANGKIAADE